MGGGVSDMRTSHLQYWMAETTHEEWLDTENWDQVVGILQTNFCDGRLPTEWIWQTVVLISKGNGEFIGN